MSKLYKILISIQKSEYSWAKKFLRSPYFNHKLEPLRLFEALRAYHPKYELVDKTELYSLLRPGFSFDAKWLNDRFSELSRLLELFIQTEQLKHDREIEHITRIKTFSERKLQPLFVKESKRASQYFHSQIDQSPYARLRLWEIHHNVYHHPGTPNTSAKFEAEQKAHHYLDQYYCLSKLALAANVAGSAKTYSSQIEDAWLSAVTQYSEKFQHIPLLTLYRQILLFFQAGCSLEEYLQVTQAFLANPADYG